VENLEIVPSARASREDEFIGLLTAHKHQVFNLIFCIVHSLADAEDVFQQTSLALWQNFDQFQPDSDFGAWAATIARHRILNFLRTKRRERLYFSGSVIEQLADCPFDSGPQKGARLRALSECRQRLSDNDQTLVAHCYGGEPICSVADRIGRPVQAVYKSLARIRRMLFDCIERKLAQETHI
jgi:RNA polymerase sigma-70 factor (ECF subfamily)